MSAEFTGSKLATAQRMVTVTEKIDETSIVRNHTH